MHGSQMLTGIDHVSEATKFNETYLLKGSTLGTSSEKRVNACNAGIEGKLVGKGVSIRAEVQVPQKRFVITKGSTTIKDALKFNLHVGADADMTN